VDPEHGGAPRHFDAVVAGWSGFRQHGRADLAGVIPVIMEGNTMTWFAMCGILSGTYPLCLLAVALIVSLWSWGCSPPTGKKDDPRLDAVPDTLDFGDTHTRLPLTLRNLGGGELIWTLQPSTVGWVSVYREQGNRHTE